MAAQPILPDDVMLREAAVVRR